MILKLQKEEEKAILINKNFSLHKKLRIKALIAPKTVKKKQYIYKRKRKRNIIHKKKFVKINYRYKKKITKSVRKWKKFFLWKKKRYSYRFKRKRSFCWVKRKKLKSGRNSVNFFYFFKRFYKNKIQWYKTYLLKVQKNNEDRDFKDAIEILSLYDKFPIKMRRKRLFKKNYKKKNALISRLKIVYDFKGKNRFSKVKSFLHKKFYKLRYLFFYFESLVSTVCLRFHFFWTLKRAKYWVSWGAISINDLFVTRLDTRVMVNDILRVTFPKKLFYARLVKIYGVEKFHTKLYVAINYSECFYHEMIGILLRIPLSYKEIKQFIYWRKLKWVKLSTFLYLTNSFY